jgi:hypothetical protein
MSGASRDFADMPAAPLLQRNVCLNFPMAACFIV